LVDVTLRKSRWRFKSVPRRFIARGGFVGALTVVGALGAATRVEGAQTFTGSAHSGVVTPRGITAQGKYVWISDIGNSGRGAKVVRLDASTGATRDASSPFISLPFDVVASRRYAWVMNNTLGKPQQWSLLRINASTLAVVRVQLPTAAPDSLGYVGDPILLAGHYVWIPCDHGIMRVNTSTLATTKITSPLIFGTPMNVVADSRYLWMNPPGTAGFDQKFLVRVSVDTGAVTKESFPGLGFAYPIGDDGTNVWLMDKKGIQRVNVTNDRVMTIALPKEAQISIPSTGPSAVANGAIYFCADATGRPRSGLVRIGITSGLATVVSSAQFDFPNDVTAANGIVWVVNTYGGTVHHPILVRTS